MEIGRVSYAHGVGTHAASKYRLRVHGEALEFRAKVGADTSIRSATLGAFNVSPVKREIVVDLSGMGLTGEWKVRDLWRCRDEKPVLSYYRVTLPSHAPHFIRLIPGADGRLAPGVQDVRDAAWSHLFDNRDKRATFEECKTCPKPTNR